jgi:pseudouridine-5'-phosphate glycosidase/pseudouridine kinase
LAERLADQTNTAFCDPTSVPKLPRLTSALLPLLPSSPSDHRPLTHLSPNTLELDLIHQHLTSASPALEERSWEYISSLNLTSEWRAKVEALSHRPGLGLEWITREGIVQKAVGCLPWVTSLWIKAGMRGLLHLRITTVKPEPASSDISQRLEGMHEGKYLALTHYPAVEVPEGEVVSTTGAGDTLVGGLVAGLLSREEETVWVQRAMERVTRTLRSRRAVG